MLELGREPDRADLHRVGPAGFQVIQQKLAARIGLRAAARAGGHVGNDNRGTRNSCAVLAQNQAF